MTGGRAYPPGRRQIVGCVFHMNDSDRYRRLNDVVCMCAGEVRAPDDANRERSDLVVDVAELIWDRSPNDDVSHWRSATRSTQPGQAQIWDQAARCAAAAVISRRRAATA
jgi:hypothetical protein